MFLNLQRAYGDRENQLKGCVYILADSVLEDICKVAVPVKCLN